MESVDARSTPYRPQDGGGPSLSEQVQDALAHLHDPTYLQTHPLARLAIGTQAAKHPNAGKALRLALEEAVEAIRPEQGTPGPSHGWRGYEILRSRYLEGQGVRGVIAELAISRSEYYRDHRQAVDAVAGVLTQRWGVADGAGPGTGKTGAVVEQPAPHRAAVGSPPNNLPLALTSFVGREREIAEVTRLLGKHRLVTLTGSGGCGKTRLALEVARGRVGQYRDGLWLVELASLADPSLVPQTVAFALGVRETPGEPIATTLEAYLRNRDALLVLDDCEHLLDACAFLAVLLLRSCPKLTILATSRQSLGVAGEVIWSVPPLETVDPERLPSSEDLSRLESVRLFAERARAAIPGFQLTAASSRAVAGICWKLDGNPLAVELAAARTRTLAVEQISRRLDDRFGLLTGGSRGSLPRQQTLRATIDWSHNMLTVPEKALFRRLAVFAGGWTLAAAEDVCAGEEVPRGDVLDLLSRLVDKSLALVDPGPVEARYRLLATIHEYARERLAEAGEEDAVRGKHLDHFLGIGERALTIIWQSDEQGILIDRLEADHDNLRAALRWSQRADPSSFRRLAASLWTFWTSRGYTAEGRHWIEEALEVTPERDGTRAEALRGVGMLASDQGDKAGARAHWEQCVALCRELGERHGEGLTLAFLGTAAIDEDDLERARECLEAASAPLRETGDWVKVGWTLERLSCISGTQGDYRRARAYLEESEALIPRSRVQSVWLLVDLGDACSVEGDYERARMHLEAALSIAVEARDEPCRGVALATLGNVARLLGNHEAAPAYLGEGLRVLKAIGHRQRVGFAMALSALLAADEGRHEGVARLVGAATAIHQHFGAHLWKAERDALEAALGAAREALGEESFSRAFAEGQAMSLDEAVEYALSE